MNESVLPPPDAEAASRSFADSYSPQLRTALILTGTGTAGAYHAGVLRAFHEAGARVHCVTGDHQQIEEVRSGGSFYSQNDLRIHFGLGKVSHIDKLEVHWPSNQVDHFADIPANQILKVVEGSAKLVPANTVRR